MSKFVLLAAFAVGASLGLIRPRAADRLATRERLLQNLNRETEDDTPWVLADGGNENARDETHDAVKIYKRDAPTATPKNNVVVFSANEDAAAARCVDVFLRQDGSYGFDEFRRGDGEGWTPTLPDFYSREKYGSAAEARAEARAAIPWFEAWEEGADVLDASRLSEEEIPCCSEMKYCGASPAALKDEEEALVNAAAVMGFSYAYEGFGI